MNRQHSEVFDVNGNQQTGTVQAPTEFPMTLQSNHRTLHRQKMLNNRPVSESSRVRRPSNSYQGEANNASWDQIPQRYHATKANIESKIKKADQKKKDSPPIPNISVARISGSEKCPEIPFQKDDLDYCEHAREYRNVKQTHKQGKERKHKGSMKQQQQQQQQQQQVQQPVQASIEHKSKNQASDRVSKSKMVASSRLESSSKNFNLRSSKKSEIAKSGKNRSSNPSEDRVATDLSEALRRLNMKSEASSKATTTAIAPKARNMSMKAISKNTEQETQKKKSSGHYRCHSELTRSCDHTQSQRFSGRSPNIDVRAVTAHADANTRYNARPNSNQQKLQKVVGEHDHKFLRDHLPGSTKCNPAQGSDLQYAGTVFPTSYSRKDGVQHQRPQGTRRKSEDVDNDAVMKEQQRKHIQRTHSTPCLIDSMRATHASPFVNKQSKKTSTGLGELIRNVSSSHRRKKSEAKQLSDKWNMVLHDGWGEF